MLQATDNTNNERQQIAIDWKMEKFNPGVVNTIEEIIGNKITKVSSENAIIDFYNNAFPIDKLTYTITSRAKSGNKFVKGYISMEDFISLDKELESIIQMDSYYKTNQDPNFNNAIDKKGFFEYQGKCNSKDSSDVYSRIFKIMPSRLQNNVLIVVQNALAVVDENGGVQPTGTRENLCIPVEYKKLRGMVGKILLHYNAYLNAVYSGKAKITFRE